MIGTTKMQDISQPLRRFRLTKGVTKALKVIGLLLGLAGAIVVVGFVVIFYSSRGGDFNPPERTASSTPPPPWRSPPSLWSAGCCSSRVCRARSALPALAW